MHALQMAPFIYNMVACSISIHIIIPRCDVMDKLLLALAYQPGIGSW